MRKSHSFLCNIFFRARYGDCLEIYYYAVSNLILAVKEYEKHHAISKGIPFSLKLIYFHTGLMTNNQKFQ